MYAIVRNDLGMGAGKCASQAGHAYVGALLQSQQSHTALYESYAALTPGTKVALQASGAELFRAKLHAEAAGLPVYLVIDSGCPDFFNGLPTPTALGIGPVKGKLPGALRRLKLL